MKQSEVSPEISFSKNVKLKSKGQVTTINKTQRRIWYPIKHLQRSVLRKWLPTRLSQLFSQNTPS